MQNQDNGESDRDRSRLAKNLGLLSTITTEIVGLTGAGLVAGWYAEKHWGAPQILTPLLAIAGFGLAMVQVIRTIQLMSRNDNQENGTDEQRSDSKNDSAGK